MSESYDILEDCFCLYCLQEYASPTNLQRHVLRMHPNTIAAQSIKAAQEKNQNRE